jgi:hypothetical protein
MSAGGFSYNRNWQLHWGTKISVLVSFLGFGFYLFSPLDPIHCMFLVLRCVVGFWIHPIHTEFQSFLEFFLFLGKFIFFSEASTPLILHLER